MKSPTLSQYSVHSIDVSWGYRKGPTQCIYVMVRFNDSYAVSVPVHFNGTKQAPYACTNNEDIDPRGRLR